MIEELVTLQKNFGHPSSQRKLLKVFILMIAQYHLTYYLATHQVIMQRKAIKSALFNALYLFPHFAMCERLAQAFFRKNKDCTNYLGEEEG